MHDQLAELHARVPGRLPGKAWFDEPSWVRHRWFNDRAREQIASAKERAGHTQGRPRPGKVVAGLNFGFWRFLASVRYEQSFWVPALDKAFVAPGLHAGDRREAVEQRLVLLHKLRNRISHCEPIIHPIRHTFRQKPEVTRTPAQLYADAVELVSFISPEAARWLEHETRSLQRLLHNRPGPYPAL
jgi:hypothetical protein